MPTVMTISVTIKYLLMGRRMILGSTAFETRLLMNADKVLQAR
jgi:hypothetical protein